MRMTIKIVSLCVLIQVLGSLFPSLLDALSFSTEYFLWPLQAITYQFAHANWGHLEGNMVFGIPFMLYLEHRIGGKRMLCFFLACGLASLALHCLLMGSERGLIGASGSLFGVGVGSAALFGRNRLERHISLLFVSALLVPQFIMIVLSLGGLLAPIALWAHVGGGLAGLVMAYEHRIRTMELGCRKKTKARR